MNTLCCKASVAEYSTGMARRGKRSVNPIDYFPAEARKDGRFAKRINGKVYYFGGPGRSRDEAMAEYQRSRHQLYAGQEVQRPSTEDYTRWTLRNFSNKYLEARRAEIMAGTLRKVTYLDLRYSLAQFVHYVGGRRLVSELCPDVFSAAANHFKGKLSGCRYNHVVSAVNAWLNYAANHTWLKQLPVFGPLWKKIPLSQLPNRDRMVAPEELHRLLSHASEQMRVMLLLAINGGMGPSDLASLAIAEVNGDVIRCHRPKTKIKRVVPLWPETVEALEDWLTARISEDPHVFITKYSRPWDAPDIVHQFTDLRRAAGFDMEEKWGIYALRHTFSTIADDFGDGNAKRLIMGQKFPGMDAVYVAGKRLERLREVVELVRAHFLAAIQSSPISSK